MVMNRAPRSATRDTDVEDEYCLADVAERLMAQFGAEVDLPTISRVVMRCRRDLRGVPAAALEEHIERLARQRLLANLNPMTPGDPVDSDDPVAVSAQA